MKDRRDLADLTRPSPWPREQLLVPDDLPDEALGSLDSTGLSVAFPLTTRDGRTVPVVWQMHNPLPDGMLWGGADCRAVAIVTCTDIGDGFTLVETRDTDNSDFHIAVYRFASEPITSITVQGPDRVATADLVEVLIHTHTPTDAELLDLLRPDGYQTDWT